MSTVSTSYTSSSMKRLTGLVSGLDVDSLVKQMVIGQQNKLDKANQQRQLIDWQKEAYRSVVTKISDFQGKHLDILNSSSILRTSAFKSSSATVPSSAQKYVSVSSATDSLPSSIVINEIKSLATAQKIEGSRSLSDVIAIAMSESSIMSDSGGDALGGSFSITLDGVTKNITLSNDINNYQNASGDFDASLVMKDLNEQLVKMFGSNKETVNGVTTDVPKLSFSIETTDKLNNAGSIIDTIFNFKLDVIEGSSVKVSGAGLGDAIDFKGEKTNYLDTNKSIGELFIGKGLKIDDDSSKVKFSINGVNFEFESTAKMKDVITAINSSSAGVKASYSSLDDKLVFTSASTGVGENIVLKDLANSNFFATVLGQNSDFSSDSNVIGKDSDGNDILEYFSTGFGVVTEGEDAVLTVNGSRIIRSSNTFTIDGVKVELLEATPDAFGDIPVTGTIDTTQAIENIKEFVTSYNEMIEFLNGVVREEKQKGYSPLTNEQKSSMSEKEVENWEKAAKSGLLRGDSVITKMISDMRTAMVSMVTPNLGGNKVSLASVGISISNSTTGTSVGTLTIDEEKLQAAIERDPEAVIKLFTQSSDIPKGQTLTNSYVSQGYTTQSELNKARFSSLGLGQRVSEIISAAIGTSYSSTGSLIKIAGTGGKNQSVDYQSSLNQKLLNIDKTISQLQTKLYEAEDKAYLKMSKLETALASLNNQSSYLFSQ